MKHLLQITKRNSLFLIGLWPIWSCVQEAAIPVIVDEDYSVPVWVVMDNQTIKAAQYQWTFIGSDFVDGRKGAVKIKSYTIVRKKPRYRNRYKNSAITLLKIHV